MNKRPETGPMQFHGDWTGLFVRGDNASAYAFMLQDVLVFLEEKMEQSPEEFKEIQFSIFQLRGLLDLLLQTNEFVVNPEKKQLMLEFKNCVATESFWKKLCSKW